MFLGMFLAETVTAVACPLPRPGMTDASLSRESTSGAHKPPTRAVADEAALDRLVKRALAAGVSGRLTFAASLWTRAKVAARALREGDMLVAAFCMLRQAGALCSQAGAEASLVPRLSTHDLQLIGFGVGYASALLFAYRESVCLWSKTASYGACVCSACSRHGTSSPTCGVCASYLTMHFFLDAASLAQLVNNDFGRGESVLYCRLWIMLLSPITQPVHVQVFRIVCLDASLSLRRRSSVPKFLGKVVSAPCDA